jgi:hypothetical protein
LFWQLSLVYTRRIGRKRHRRQSSMVLLLSNTIPPVQVFMIISHTLWLQLHTIDDSYERAHTL